MSANKESEDWVYTLALAAVLLVGIGAYQAADSRGWLPREEDSVITAQANWFVGESKDCMSYPLDLKSARASHQNNGYAASMVTCDGGPEHNVRITFYGRVVQPEYTWVQWRCTRNESSFTCKETGASPPALTGTDNGTGRPVRSRDGGKTWEWADQ